MLYFLKDKSDCSGCTACKAVCPMQCIEMIRDERGFLYPSADISKCVSCGKCESVCPLRSEEIMSGTPISEQIAAAAVTRNDAKWQQASSGGAFGAICDCISRNCNNVLVYGAIFDGLYVKHIGENYPKIQKMFKSKYVQSDMGNCFNEIKERLKKGDNVIFSGTPCQVAGLRKFLSKDYDNLFCIDFICHGVGSPKVFDTYIREREKKEKKRIAEYTFRCKVKKMGDYKRHISKITYEDGKYDYELIDNYNALFLDQLCLRDCCGENCRFRNQHRGGDITIADFNSFSKVFPKIYDSRGYSSIVVNTVKGEEIFKRLNEYMIIYQCDIDVIKKENPLFYKTTSENPKRNDFFNDYINGMTISELKNKYIPERKQSIKGIIVQHMPYWAKYTARNLIRCLNGK